MKLDRRQFMQASGAAAAGLAVSQLGFDLKPVRARARMIKTRYAKETTTIFTKKNAKGQVVNRTTGIASAGSAAIDNEECWTLQALMRAMGLVYIEHQARI